MQTQHDRMRLDFCGWRALVLALGIAGAAVSAGAIEVRLKDIVRVDGINTTEIIGYGVVVGLAGTGDKDIELTKRTMANILQNFQIALPSKDIKSKNVAVVMVTAKANVFHQKGDRVDVSVSSVGDAVSLQGGVLLMSPLLDAEGRLYALAQGSLILGGYSAGVGGAGGDVQTKNHTTVGRIPSGATLVNERPSDFIQNGHLRLILRNPDFTTMDRIVKAINNKFANAAVAVDGGVLTVCVPTDGSNPEAASDFLANLEAIKVIPDVQARIIVNERTGTIVIGGDVRIGEAIVAHGDLTVHVGSTLTAYMPNQFTTAEPVVTDKIITEVKEDNASILLVPGTASIQDLADLLNQLGTTPRDLISILQALQNLGAIQMELVVM